MRVISGLLRGMKLCSPNGDNTRPTLDRVKEAVFSMLLPYLSDAVVLDAFAGSGALGIEALSRGASKAFFIDSDKISVECIRKNISNARLGEKSEVICTDAISFLSSCDKEFDLIFIDPPYKKNLYDSVLKTISKNNLLAENGLIIIEWEHDFGFTDNLYAFQIVKEKKYGKVGITVLKRG